MKRIVIYLIFAVLVVSCTQNDGDIGHLFGKWQLREKITADESVAYDSIFYNFQSRVVELQRVYPEYVVERAWGYFKHNEDELVLTINNRSSSAVEIFQLPDTLAIFEVQELTNKKMVLRLDETTYRFRKFGN